MEPKESSTPAKAQDPPQSPSSQAFADDQQNMPSSNFQRSSAPSPSPSIEIFSIPPETQKRSISSKSSSPRKPTLETPQAPELSDDLVRWQARTEEQAADMKKETGENQKLGEEAASSEGERAEKEQEETIQQRHLSLEVETASRFHGRSRISLGLSLDQ